MERQGCVLISCPCCHPDSLVIATAERIDKRRPASSPPCCLTAVPLVQLFALRFHIRIRSSLQCINRQSPFLPCSLTSLHVFTAVACSVLPAFFFVIPYYPKCSLYPPTSYSFPSVVWSHCSSLSPPLTLVDPLLSYPPSHNAYENSQSSVFSFLSHPRPMLAQIFFLPLYLEARSPPVVLLLGASYAKIRRVFVSVQLPVDSESRISNFSLCTYIPSTNLLDAVFLFLSIYSSFLSLVHSAD